MKVSRIHMLVLGVMTNLLAFGLPGRAQQPSLTDLQRVYKPDCQSVKVAGSVRVPTRFELQRPTHLSELLALSGGLDVKAGKTVRVIHMGMASVCSDNKESDPGSRSDLSEDFDLAEVVRGEGKANPWMKPGDIVVVSFTDVVYVVGAVRIPQPIGLNAGLTLTQAIALAGGPWKNSKLVRVRLLRVSAGAEPESKTVLILRELRNKPSVDPMLRGNDIIEVSDERGSFGHGWRPSSGLISGPVLPLQIVKKDS